MKSSQRYKTARLTDEHGSALVLYAVVLLALFVFMVLGYGVVGAMAIRINQESSLSAVSEQQMHPEAALQTKNSPDPGMMIAKKAVAKLRETGFNEHIEIWFYEVAPHEVPADRRIYAYEVVLTSPHEVPFGSAAGIEELKISSSQLTSAMPYAELSAWRPSTTRNGLFEIQANSDKILFVSKNLSDMPNDLRAAIDSDLNNL